MFQSLIEIKLSKGKGRDRVPIVLQIGKLIPRICNGYTPFLTTPARVEKIAEVHPGVTAMQH